MSAFVCAACRYEIGAEGMCADVATGQHWVDGHRAEDCAAVRARRAAGLPTLTFCAADREWLLEFRRMHAAEQMAEQARALRERAQL